MNKTLTKIIKIVIAAITIYTVHYYVGGTVWGNLGYGFITIKIIEFAIYFFYGLIISILIFDKFTLKNKKWTGNLPGMILTFILATMGIWTILYKGWPNFVYVYCIEATYIFQIALGIWTGIILREKLGK